MCRQASRRTPGRGQVRPWVGLGVHTHAPGVGTGWPSPLWGRTVTEAGGGWGPRPMSGGSGWPGWIPAPRGPRKRPCHPHSQQHRVLSAVVAGRWCLVATLASWTDLSNMGHARVAPQDSLPVRYLLGRCPWVPWPRAADGAHAADSQHLSVQAGRPDGMAG